MATRLVRLRTSRSDIVLSNGSYNRTEGEIPRSLGFVDMTSSRVVFDVNVDTQDNGGVNINIPITVGLNGEGMQSIIRTSQVTYNRQLKNESRWQNVVRSNLDHLKRSRASDDQASVFNPCNTRNFGNGWTDRIPDCNLVSTDGGRPRDIIGTDATTIMSGRRSMVPIPLSHVDQFGQFPEWPIVEAADAAVDIEFETEIRVVYPATRVNTFSGIVNRAAVGNNLGGAAAPLTTTRTSSNFARPPVVGDYVTLWFKEAGNPCILFSDRITVVTTTGPGAPYVITLNTGAATVGAASACTVIHLFYGEASNVIPGAAIPGAQGSTNCYTVDNVASVGSLIGNAASPLLIGNFYDLNSAISTNQTPLSVGDPIVVTVANGATNAGFAAYTRVATIRQAGRDMVLTVTDPVNIAGGGTDLGTGIRIAHRDYRTDTSTLFNTVMTINETYMDLRQLLMPSDAYTKLRAKYRAAVLPYLEWRVDPEGIEANTIKSIPLTAAPYCMGVIVMTPQNNALVSGFDTVNQYTATIDNFPQIKTKGTYIAVGNIDRTARAVQNYLMKMFHTNIQTVMMKYDAQTIDYRRINDMTNRGMYYIITPVVGHSQLIQLKLSAPTPWASKQIYPVYFHLRNVSFNGTTVNVTDPQM